MKELVEVIAKALVDNPDEVVVTESEKEEEIVIELKVAPTDMGKVIGKQGRIAKAIRSVVKALKFSNREGLWTGFFPAAVPFLLSETVSAGRYQPCRV